MSDAILHEILLKLGRIEEGQERVRLDLDEEKRETRDHRHSVVAKIDDMGDRIDKVENSIAISATIDVQVRNELNEIKPTIEDFRRMRAIGIGIVGIVGLGGAAFGASLIWWGEQTISAIRHLLRIS